MQYLYSIFVFVACNETYSGLRHYPNRSTFKEKKLYREKFSLYVREKRGLDWNIIYLREFPCIDTSIQKKKKIKSSNEEFVNTFQFIPIVFNFKFSKISFLNSRFRINF